MVYQFKPIRVTISGTCFGAAEEWSTGFFVGDEDDDATAPTQAFVDDVATYWQTFFTASNSKISNRYQTTEVKAALLNADGSTDIDSVVHHTYGTAISGVYTVNHNVPQASLVVTLTSANLRGLASKGRMYLPGYAPSIGTDGKISGTDIGLVSTTFQTFMNAVNGSFNIPGAVILASKGRPTAVPPLAGPSKTVTGYKIGNVYDTQRRRRNQLVETYTSGTITP
jgi:hypothetical protein